MRSQEVITLFAEAPSDRNIRTYPELDEWFNKGMYIESITQTELASAGKFCITFILKYYNTSTSRDKV